MTLIVLLAGATTAPGLADDHPAPAKAPFTAQQAKKHQQQWAKYIGKELVYTNSIGMKMVLLPPGEFMMGVSEKDTYEKLCDNMLKSRTPTGE